MIALIHYELDEREAAELMYQSQLSGKSNLYHRELGFWLGASKEQVTPDHSWLSEYSSVDYMVVEKIARYFQEINDYPNALQVCHYASHYYEKSYLEEKIQLQLILSLGNTADLIEKANFLHKKFPYNPDYLFCLGYGQLNSKSYKDAVETLELAADLSHHRNPDILKCLGHAYVERFRKIKRKAFISVP